MDLNKAPETITALLEECQAAPRTDRTRGSIAALQGRPRFRLHDELLNRGPLCKRGVVIRPWQAPVIARAGEFNAGHDAALSRLGQRLGLNTMTTGDLAATARDFPGLVQVVRHFLVV